MEQNEIKRANRKAMPKFILLMMLSLIVGGTIGFCSAKFGLNALSGQIKAAGELFGMYIAPWAILAIAVLMPAVSALLYRKAKRLLSAWDGEDEEVSDAVDSTLSIVLWLTDCALILSFFLITASYSGGFAMFEKRENPLPFFLAIAAFFAILIEAVVFQQKCVDASKKMNPEKTASVYDMKFQKKWLDACDEAEKAIIGRCAFKAYRATNHVCLALAVVLALCALIFETGFLPALVVCVIWFVNQSAYCKEASRCSRSGNKVQ